MQRDGLVVRSQTQAPITAPPQQQPLITRWYRLPIPSRPERTRCPEAPWWFFKNYQLAVKIYPSRGRSESAGEIARQINAYTLDNL
jgi:hypothetical protein